MFRLSQKLLLGETDTLNQMAVANWSAVDARRNQLRMGVEIGAKGLELDAGGDPKLLAAGKGIRVKAVEPARIGVIGREAIDLVESGATIGPEKQRNSHVSLISLLSQKPHALRSNTPSLS